jgi:hypothetical protein
MMSEPVDEITTEVEELVITPRRPEPPSFSIKHFDSPLKYPYLALINIVEEPLLDSYEHLVDESLCPDVPKEVRVIFQNNEVANKCFFENKRYRRDIYKWIWVLPVISKAVQYKYQRLLPVLQKLKESIDQTIDLRDINDLTLGQETRVDNEGACLLFDEKTNQLNLVFDLAGKDFGDTKFRAICDVLKMASFKFGPRFNVQKL